MRPNSIFEKQKHERCIHERRRKRFENLLVGEENVDLHISNHRGKFVVKVWRGANWNSCIKFQIDTEKHWSRKKRKLQRCREFCNLDIDFVCSYCGSFATFFRRLMDLIFTSFLYRIHASCLPSTNSARVAEITLCSWSVSTARSCIYITISSLERSHLCSEAVYCSQQKIVLGSCAFFAGFWWSKRVN